MRSFSVLLDLLFPPKCPFCGKLLENGQALLCPDCQRELPWTQGKIGERKGEFFTLCTAPLWYRERVRDSHHRYKFSGVRAYARVYAVLMAQCVAERLTGGFDRITWVPISPWRRYRRGYDQAQLLARHLGAQLHVPCRRLLRKIRNTRPQSSLQGESQRRANVMGAYVVCRGEEIAGRRILLVDDVITTGSTLSECARMLRMAGAAEVVCVTLAITDRDMSDNLHKTL